jgi:hypothetical protein
VPKARLTYLLVIVLVVLPLLLALAHVPYGYSDGWG